MSEPGTEPDTTQTCPTIPAQGFKDGDWVTPTRGRYSGRTGMFDGFKGSTKASIRFGADGPTRALALTTLRLAYPQEIAARLDCKIKDLPDAVMRRAQMLD